MKNIFNNPITRFVRNDSTDHNRRSQESRTESQTSPSQPTFYHHPASTTTTTNPYSHTASSTAGYAQHSTYPTLNNSNQERDRSSLLGKIESTATNLVGTLVGPDNAAAMTHHINSAITTGPSARELLRNGAIVQLVSKSSGCLLQIVMSPNGVLTFDGNGSHNSFNTYFMIEEGEKGRLRFHNNCNYLAFDGKKLCVLTLPPGPKNNTQVDFRVHDIVGNHDLIALESCHNKNHFISILNDGLLKTSNMKDKNIDAQFSVVAVPMFPYQAPPPQHYQTNPYGGFPQGGYASSQPPQPSAPPPSSAYDRTDSYAPPSSNSSSLYPQIH